MASTILELAASMLRIFGQMRPRRLLTAVATAVAVLCVETHAAARSAARSRAAAPW
jgi:hypothetical protein